MQYTLPDLLYDYKALEPFIDGQTMKIHHDKHHAAYVANLNDALLEQPQLSKMKVEELIQNLDKVPEDIRTKVRNNGGGHANHSLFWQIMHANTKRNDASLLMQALNSTFGDLSSFKEKFTSAAMGRFGSGWAWLVVNKGKLKVVDTPNQDSPLMQNLGNPVLGLDVWEHAYYLKYQNRRVDYILAWWNVVNWQEVNKCYETLMSAL